MLLFLYIIGIYINIVEKTVFRYPAFVVAECVVF